MTDLLIEILGNYVPLSGDGIASVNPVWICSALLFILFVWAFLRLLINLTGGRK